ncbi:MAG: epsG 2 [Phycisphaerales bacterium]|jgi:prepilin-type N-terminal cleavage/methylation domain-containing protein/prepilin-type processing-associated H-X9-DG protein|nr:epsG 2 [Phycisphaerales bacterium]
MMSDRRFQRAFTLVELLVVIGIIGVLLTILIPVVSRARESSKQTQCMSNLRQLGNAVLSYAISNEDHYPFAAWYVGTQYNDWIAWEQPTRSLDQSALSKYMGSPVRAEVFICPSDDVTNRVRTSGYGQYKYSYVMNYLLSEKNMHSVKSPAQKAIFYEEDERTIDDGYGTPEPGGSINMLAIRHDRSRKQPDDTTTALTLNGSCRGNAAFCDGHAEYVTRNSFHSQATYDPAY